MLNKVLNSPLFYRTLKLTVKTSTILCSIYLHLTSNQYLKNKADKKFGKTKDGMTDVIGASLST